MKRICKWCNNAFEIPRSRPNQIYCSRECAWESQRVDMPICPICGKKFKQRQGYRRTCSNKCFGVYNDNLSIAEYERMHGINMGQYLRQRYVDNGLTLHELLLELGMADNHRRLKRWFDRYDIKVRTRSEGVKLQHKRQPERARAFIDMGKSVEVRLRQATSRQANHKSTSLEAAAISILSVFGVHGISQYAVDKYNLDIGIPHLKIGIEIDGGNWHKERKQKGKDSERDTKLKEWGWTIKRFQPEQFGELIELARNIIG